ncbi:unnamed protein product [Cuscuta campestris]|uniref:Uncharacterized protein n=1 Tax=Cuscuta campestris TaxID=132261 RepID=A0A484KE00_9ASTE|nr:unnamed protein product [Cuscuta campestris]
MGMLLIFYGVAFDGLLKDLSSFCLHPHLFLRLLWSSEVGNNFIIASRLLTIPRAVAEPEFSPMSTIGRFEHASFGRSFHKDNVTLPDADVGRIWNWGKTRGQRSLI